MNNGAPSTFLSATWENLAMFNYEVDPAILKKHIPPFTELDYFKGKALVSVVGFLFDRTRVMGIRWPYHHSFEEVNLRLYVKRYDGAVWKRGVAFISEIVPRPIISLLANTLYNEHYSTARMTHRLHLEAGQLEVEYRWKQRNRDWSSMNVTAESAPEEIPPNSEQEFIFEHYFGYSGLNERKTVEYSVHHPRWKIYPVISHTLNLDVAHLYGVEFLPFLTDQNVHSVFLAQGSEVKVGKPVILRN